MDTIVYKNVENVEVVFPDWAIFTWYFMLPMVSYILAIFILYIIT